MTLDESTDLHNEASSDGEVESGLAKEMLKSFAHERLGS